MDKLIRYAIVIGLALLALYVVITIAGCNRLLSIPCKSGWVTGRGLSELALTAPSPLICRKVNIEGNAVQELTNKSFDFDSILKTAAFFLSPSGRITGHVGLRTYGVLGRWFSLCIGGE